MLTMTQANTIKSAARGYFWWGHKSSNKLYSLESDDPSYAKKTLRNDNAIKAKTLIWKHRTSTSLSFDKHLERPFDERAGNCGEYTGHAVNLALTMDPDSTVWTFGCRETLGVDHIFCVFNLPQAPNNLPCLKTMSSENSYHDVIVCDPWANIVCLYTDYPKRLMDKMITWNTCGKSIILGTSAMSAIEWGRRCLNAPAHFEQKR